MAQTAAQQVIIQGQILAERAGISLPSTAADQLSVNSRRIMQLAANHMQASERVGLGGQFNICSSAGHIGGNSHFARLPCGGNNFRFPIQMPRVEHLVIDASIREHFGQRF